MEERIIGSEYKTPFPRVSNPLRQDSRIQGIQSGWQRADGLRPVADDLRGDGIAHPGLDSRQDVECFHGSSIGRMAEWPKRAEQLVRGNHQA